MDFIDTHSHLNDDTLYRNIEAVIRDCAEKKIRYVVNNADSLESFSRILELKERFSICGCALGIHPEFASESDAYFNKAYQQIKENKDRILAIGEIGLDYHYSKEERYVQAQKQRFIEQIKLADELDLPIVIHTRDADFDTLNIIKEYRPKKIDLHCYSGSAEILREYLKLPIEVHIGIGGVSTFKNAKTLQNIIREFPLDIFLTETDAPYLAPTPHRGETNTPAYIPLIVSKIAELKEIDVEVVANKLYENGRNFYGIKRVDQK